MWLSILVSLLSPLDIRNVIKKESNNNLKVVRTIKIILKAANIKFVSTTCPGRPYVGL